MPDKFVVRLSDDHRHFVNALIDRARCSPTTFIRAMILKRADAALTGEARRDEEIAREVHASASTVYRVRKRFAERGLQAALFPKERPSAQRAMRSAISP